MKTLAVIHHGAYGHTGHIAKHVLQGARVSWTRRPICSRRRTRQTMPGELPKYDGHILDSRLLSRRAASARTSSFEIVPTKSVRTGSRVEALQEELPRENPLMH